MADDDPSPPQPRPGSQGSHPSASHYVVELPYPEELQVMLEGRYSVEGFLGRGGMGAVYRGLQLPLRRPVAIKILQKKQEGVGDEYEFEERFKREAYAMATLTHPHIVQVYDCGDAGEHFLFISMELVEGGDLSDAIKGGAMTPDMALKLIPQICDGLQAAHERGIVHRDIKPANIFLTKEGRAKVADFGLAKKFDTKSTFMTKAGLGMGTPDYAAPEQYDGIADIDHRADIYSLGVMMYQMLTGKLPRGTTFKSPSQLVPVNPGVDAIVSRAMASEREERYQSVAEIKTELARLTPKPTNTMAVPVARAADATGTAPVATARPATTPRPATQTRPTAPAPAAVQRPTGKMAAPAKPTVAKVPASAPRAAKKPSKLVPIGLVVVLAIIAGAWFTMRGGNKGTSEASAVVPEANVAAEKSDLPAVAPRVKTTFPVGEWVRVLDSPEQLPAKMRSEDHYIFRDGWMISNDDRAPHLGIFGVKGKNWGMRLQVKIMPGKTGIGPASLFLRKADADGPRYLFALNTQENVWKIAKSRGKSTVSQEIASMPAITPLKEGDLFTMEFVAIGNRLVGRVNGVLLPAGTDDELTFGSLSLTTRHATRNVDVINLEGLTEADALRLAGVDESGRDLRAGGAAPPGPKAAPWIQVDVAKIAPFDDGKKVRKMEDGLLHMVGPPLGYTGGAMTDGALRATTVWKEPTRMMQLKMRSGKEVNCGARLSIDLLIIYEQTEKSKTTDLLRVPLLKPMQPEMEVVLETATIGSTIYARLNGQFIGKAETTVTERGTGGLGSAGGAWVKRLEHLKLDGVPDALGLLGWDVSKGLPSAPPPP